jgi:hypothetical protein
MYLYCTCEENNLNIRWSNGWQNRALPNLISDWWSHSYKYKLSSILFMHEYKTFPARNPGFFDRDLFIKISFSL